MRGRRRSAGTSAIYRAWSWERYSNRKRTDSFQTNVYRVTMKNIFNNSITRLVRDETNDRKKPKESKSDAPPSTVPSATLGYYPSPSAAVGDSYSHTANSTAGYSQTNTYPTLTNYSQQSERPVCSSREQFPSNEHSSLF